MTERSNKKGTRFLGEVYNPNDYMIDSAVVCVIFRDNKGKLLAGNVTFIDNIKASSKVPFDMNISKKLVTDNYEIYANLW
ncbi:hypothetical protein SDC9_123394 [bioreactor metagenome]|uniref:Uncharacterized protein n=1 Tax=bioreactor metagenome TaxID=1076179 RepID=A0A645CHI4_9ZZZZ